MFQGPSRSQFGINPLYSAMNPSVLTVWKRQKTTLRYCLQALCNGLWLQLHIHWTEISNQPPDTQFKKKINVQTGKNWNDGNITTIERADTGPPLPPPTKKNNNNHNTTPSWISQVYTMCELKATARPAIFSGANFLDYNCWRLSAIIYYDNLFATSIRPGMLSQQYNMVVCLNIFSTVHKPNDSTKFFRISATAWPVILRCKFQWLQLLTALSNYGN